MKKHLILSTLLICFLLITNISYAQTKDTTAQNFKHYVGVAAGFTTGYGISYRYFPNDFGVQLTFGPYSDDWGTEISAGVAFLYSLVKEEKTSFYLYQANHFLYWKDKYPYGYDNSTTNETESYFNNGVGFGIEFTLFNRASLNLMTGFGAYENFDRINLTGEIGIYYKL